MRLCDIKGRFLFEADPLFLDQEPRTQLTSQEIAAWAVYYEMEREKPTKH